MQRALGLLGGAGGLILAILPAAVARADNPSSSQAPPIVTVAITPGWSSNIAWDEVQVQTPGEPVINRPTSLPVAGTTTPNATVSTGVILSGLVLVAVGMVLRRFGRPRGR